jgi:hypothetical protein
LNTDDEVNVSWILDGAEQENTGKSITVAQDFAGWIAVRICDDSGNYRSNSFDCLGDIDFEKIVKPEGNVSLRIGSDDSTTGMRFISSISNDNRSAVSEYGYIVTRKTFLERFGGELTFDFDHRISLRACGSTGVYNKNCANQNNRHDQCNNRRRIFSAFFGGFHLFFPF